MMSLNNYSILSVFSQIRCLTFRYGAIVHLKILQIRVATKKTDKKKSEEK